VSSDVLCRLLAEPSRLRAFAAVVLGAATPSEVAERTGLPARTVVAALRRLEQGGLVVTDPGTPGEAGTPGGARVPSAASGTAGTRAVPRLVAREAAFAEAVRQQLPPAGPAEPLDPDRERDAVLRAFIVDDRLVQIPAARGKRRIVLEYVVACFEPGAKYPQRAVDAVLRAWHPDYASLRRHLIDEGLMAREQGVYWRIGGYVDV